MRNNIPYVVIQSNVIAKTAVFNNDRKVLLLVRSDDDDHRPGGYDLPGGGVDQGEDPAIAAAREVSEEIGLDLGRNSLELVFAECHIGSPGNTETISNMVWQGFVANMPAGATIKLSFDNNFISTGK